MEANEAPEKIYIFDNPILDFTKLNVKQGDDDIEYTRTDAFIEKVEEYIYKQLNEGRIECGDIEKFIKDFKNYMKGKLL